MAASVDIFEEIVRLRQAGFSDWELATYVAPAQRGPDVDPLRPIRSM